MIQIHSNSPNLKTIVDLVKFPIYCSGLWIFNLSISGGSVFDNPFFFQWHWGTRVLAETLHFSQCLMVERRNPQGSATKMREKKTKPSKPV